MWQPLKGKLEEAKQRPYLGPEGATGEAERENRCVSGQRD